MTTPRTQATHTQPPLIIQGSTKTILLTLYKNLMQANNIPIDSPALETAVRLDIRLAKMHNALASTGSNQTQRLNEAINIGLSKKEVAPFKAEFESNFVTFKEKSEQLKIQIETLKQQCVTFTAEQTTKARELFGQMAKGEKTEQAVLTALKTIDEAKNTLARSINDYIKTSKAVQQDLEGLYKHIYSLVQDKSKLVVPEQLKATESRRPTM